MNSEASFYEVLGGQIGTFRPVAYYDKFMDTIRIKLRDCSTNEVRLGETLTLIMDNHPNELASPCAGLVIKGVGHLFQTLGLPKSGVVRVVEVINKMLEKDLIDRDTKEKIIHIQSVATGTDMKVVFDLADAA